MRRKRRVANRLNVASRHHTTSDNRCKMLRANNLERRLIVAKNRIAPRDDATLLARLGCRQHIPFLQRLPRLQ